MSDVANGTVSIKLSNSFLVQKNYSSLHSNFISKSYLIYKLHNWSNNPSNNFTLNNSLFGRLKS